MKSDLSTPTSRGEKHISSKLMFFRQQNQIGLVNTEMNNNADLGTQLTIIAAGNKDRTTCYILQVHDFKFFPFLTSFKPSTL